MAQLKIQRHADKSWWVIGGPDSIEMGPYRRYIDAAECKRGVERFYRHCHDRSFITSEPIKESSHGAIQ